MKLGIAMALLVFVAGCYGGSIAQREYPSHTDVFKGSDAVVMNFIVNTPPSQLFEDNEFKVGVVYKNDGAEARANGLMLIGYEEDYMELASDKRISYSLQGRSFDNIFGQQERHFFDMKAKRIDPQSTHHVSTIYVTTCYEFETKASVDVCVDTDIYGLKEAQKTCDVQDQAFSNQGAPVAIKKVEYDLLPIDEFKIMPIFKIYVRNIGNGEVIARSSVNAACSGSPLSSDDLNVVTINAKLGADELTCVPPLLRLTSDTDYVRCTLDKGISTEFISYQSILEIELKYGYMSTISRDIDIQRVIQ